MAWAFTTVSATTTSTTLGTLILGGGGSGYAANITNGTLTFSGGGATTQATGTFTTNANGNVSSVSLATVGSGYTSAPTVTASGGSTPANITAVLGSTAGAAADTAATVIVTGNYGITQSLNADSTQGTNPVDGSVGATTIGLRTSSDSTGALVTNPVLGATFVNPLYTVTITPVSGGSGATAVVGDIISTANRITSITLTAGGSGYTNGATVTVSAPPSGTTATATATVTNGVVTAITVTNSTTNSGYIAQTVHTITGYTANTRRATFTPPLTTAIANNVGITLNPAIQVGAQVVLSNAVYSVTAVSSATNSVVTLFPQTGVTVPSIASGTSLTFYNPLVQSGTDTTIGTALAGLASFRGDIINAFIDNVGGYASGATSMVIDNGSGAAPAIAPTPTTTFLNNTLVHRVTAYNAGTRTITFSPALNATIANDAAITLFTPGVILNRGDGATGLDSYTVNSTRVRITGTFTQNAWAEQLIIAANCPGDPGSVNDVLAQVTLAGTITFTGIRSSWGLGSGSICPNPVLVGNLQGNSSAGNCFLRITSGTIAFNNSIVKANSFINLNSSSVTYTNAVFSNSDGSFTGNGNIIYISAASTINSITFIGFRHAILSLSNNSEITNITIDGTAGFNTADASGTVIYSNLAARNTTPAFVFRTTANFSDIPLGSGQSISRNNLTGSNLGVAGSADGFRQAGGHLIAQKQVAHFFKNLSGVAISQAKVYASDTQNLQRFNWFDDGINRAAYTSSLGQAFQPIAIANSTTLTNLWNGNAQRTYAWVSNVSGNTASQNIVLAYISNPNRRHFPINCVSNGVANATATAINVDNGTGLFANLSTDIGAPQVNGYFVWAGTRHIITSVTVNTSDYTLGLSPPLAAQVPDNTTLPVQNIWYDCRNKTRVTATIDHPSAGTYAAGVSQIVVDNGADALLATTPVPYTNFIHAGEIYLITAVSSTSTEHTLTISPNLRASIANNATITLENIPGSDFFDFRAASYPHLPQGQELNLTGTGALTNTWTLLDDATITQASKATVDAYTTLTTAAQLYDRAKAWWYDNFETLTAAQQGATLVTRSGTTLNAGSYSLTLATSGSAFSFTSPTITINAPTFADTLTTTGTITLNNPSASQINYASGIVPANGTVALATAGTYDLSGWTFTNGATISNTSSGAVTVWLNPNQVANVNGPVTNLSIVAKPQSLAAPLADGTRAYGARVQTFSIANTAINTSADTITLGNDNQGRAAAFATAAPWTQVRFSLQPGATLPSTTGGVLKDGGFYYWSGGKLYTSIANIPGTPVDFASQGSGNFTLQAETELFNTVVSGGLGLSQSLTQPDGIQIRFKATRWAVDGSGNASATQFLDTRDSLITWSAFVGATVSTTLELESVHEQIVATSYVQSGKYGQLFPAKRGDQFGSKFSIALEGVGTLQINADDDNANPAGVELLQDIFLWWCWVRSTEAGIRLASYDTLTAINFTTYQAGRVEVENTDASIPLIIAGGSISFAGSNNGIAATSNAIYLNVDVLGVVAITGLAASDIRSAVGLTSANLDSQLGDITALVL